jgi:hypothetical protein
MSILEKLRAEFVDIVEWVDDDRQSIVWRFPRYHNQIKQGAKLTESSPIDSLRGRTR